MSLLNHSLPTFADENCLIPPAESHNFSDLLSFFTHDGKCMKYAPPAAVGGCGGGSIERSCYTACCG